MTIAATFLAQKSSTPAWSCLRTLILSEANLLERGWMNLYPRP